VNRNHHQILAKYNNSQTSVPIAIGNVFDKGYRYGFNGKEKDKGEEGMGGGGSTYDYGFRIYNPGLGKFLSVYPLYKSYPWFTPYLFAGNGPILNIDVDGNKIQVKENSVKSFEFNGIVYEAQFDKQTGNFAKYLGSDGNVIDYSIKISTVVIKKNEASVVAPAQLVVTAIAAGITAVILVNQTANVIHSITLSKPDIVIGGFILSKQTGNQKDDGFSDKTDQWVKDEYFNLRGKLDKV